jgi:hypothetical protein
MHQNAFMRTTIDLPDELFRQAKARAALSGVSLRDLITRFVEHGLQLSDKPTPVVRPRRGDLPEIIPPRGRRMPVLSSAEIQAILDAEDAEAGRDRTG